MHSPDCPLCTSPGGLAIAEYKKDGKDAALFRIIRADDANFPVFYRLVWQNHVAEFSDLSPAERQLCMEAVACVEQALREQLNAAACPATKMNLASLGNVVPHLHWHIIARFDWDSHYPDPVWAAPRRTANAAQLDKLHALLPALDRAVASTINSL